MCPPGARRSPDRCIGETLPTTSWMASSPVLPTRSCAAASRTMTTPSSTPHPSTDQPYLVGTFCLLEAVATTGPASTTSPRTRCHGDASAGPITKFAPTAYSPSRRASSSRRVSVLLVRECVPSVLRPQCRSGTAPNNHGFWRESSSPANPDDRHRGSTLPVRRQR